jgi:hypothetical protein
VDDVLSVPVLFIIFIVLLYFLFSRGMCLDNKPCVREGPEHWVRTKQKKVTLTTVGRGLRREIRA